MSNTKLVADQARKGYFTSVGLIVILFGSLMCRTDPSMGLAIVGLGLLSTAYALFPRCFSFLDGMHVTFDGNPVRVIA